MFDFEIFDFMKTLNYRPELGERCRLDDEICELNENLFGRMVQVCMTPWVGEPYWLAEDIAQLVEQIVAAIGSKRYLPQCFSVLPWLKIGDTCVHVDKRSSKFQDLFCYALEDLGFSLEDYDVEAMMSYYQDFISFFYEELVEWSQSGTYLKSLLEIFTEYCEEQIDCCVAFSVTTVASIYFISDSAKSLGDYGEKCKQQFEQVFLHLVKICIFPEELKHNYHHWKQEILAFMAPLLNRDFAAKKQPVIEKILRRFKKAFVEECFGEICSDYLKWKSFFEKAIRKEQKQMNVPKRREYDIPHIIEENSYRFEAFFNELNALESIPTRDELWDMLDRFAGCC